MMSYNTVSIEDETYFIFYVLLLRYSNSAISSEFMLHISQ